MEFLGFQVNSVSAQQLSFPTEKLRKIQQDAYILLKQQMVSVRNLVRFVGKTIASVKAIWQGPITLQDTAGNDQLGSITTGNPEELGDQI